MLPTLNDPFWDALSPNVRDKWILERPRRASWDVLIKWIEKKMQSDVQNNADILCFYLIQKGYAYCCLGCWDNAWQDFAQASDLAFVSIWCIKDNGVTYYNALDNYVLALTFKCFICMQQAKFEEARETFQELENIYKTKYPELLTETDEDSKVAIIIERCKKNIARHYGEAQEIMNKICQREAVLSQEQFSPERLLNDTLEYSVKSPTACLKSPPDADNEGNAGVQTNCTIDFSRSCQMSDKVKRGATMRDGMWFGFGSTSDSPDSEEGTELLECKRR